MPSAEYDLGYIDAAVDFIEKYLLSEEVYWKMMASSPPGEPAYPSLTLGGLLLANARTLARHLTPMQDEHYLELEAKIDRVRTKWLSAWEKKAKKEFRSRLNLWRDFLEDFRQEPAENADRYAYEVSRRVMLDLLTGETRDIPYAEQQMLAGMDAIISGLLVPGEFVWDEELKAGFPREKYPYLYGTLRS